MSILVNNNDWSNFGPLSQKPLALSFESWHNGIYADSDSTATSKRPIFGGFSRSPGGKVYTKVYTPLGKVFVWGYCVSFADAGSASY